MGAVGMCLEWATISPKITCLYRLAAFCRDGMKKLGASELRENGVIRIAFAVTETGQDAAAGDYFTALELGTALSGRYGCDVEYLPEGESWYALEGVDVLIAMREDFDVRLIRQAKSSLLTVAWARNWFERWCEQPGMSSYSAVLASSRQAAHWMSTRLGRLVGTLRIATNVERFGQLLRPEADEYDFVFSGSYWGSQRDIDSALRLLEPGFRGAIFGRHWEAVPELAHWYRGFVPYAGLPDIYRRTTVVIDDANHVTKDWGAANSRVFDALAAGCLVITNSQTVSDEVFAGELPVYVGADELQDALTYYLANPDVRSSLVERLRSRVLREHGYAQRAVALYSLLQSKIRRSSL